MVRCRSAGRRRGGQGLRAKGATAIGGTGIRADGAAGDGTAEDHPRSERRCLVTGVVGPKAGLIRFAVGPDDVVVPDVEERLPGRGLWVSADRGALERAVARRLFARAARKSVTAPADLVDNTVARLRQHCLDLVGLARRSGQAVAGYEKVRSWLAEGRVGLLLAAGDGAPDGRDKLARLARAVAPHVPLVTALDAAALGWAFGRERTVHAAMARGGLARRLHEAVHRYVGVLGASGPGGVDGEPVGS